MYQSITELECSGYKTFWNLCLNLCPTTVHMQWYFYVWTWLVPRGDLLVDFVHNFIHENEWNMQKIYCTVLVWVFQLWRGCPFSSIKWPCFLAITVLLIDIALFSSLRICSLSLIIVVYVDLFVAKGSTSNVIHSPCSIRCIISRFWSIDMACCFLDEPEVWLIPPAPFFQLYQPY